MKTAVILSGFFFVTFIAAQAEVESEIPLGIEAVTGIRSDYVHRGFQLAESSLDYQIETELVLSEKTSLHFGLSHLAESSGSFSETSGYFEVSRIVGKTLTLGASATYRDRNDSLLDGGLDLGLFSELAINDNWTWRNRVSFDLGVDGIYFSSGLVWSTVLTDDAFLSIETGLSAVSGYLDRDGVNDFHSRIAVTYTLSDHISFTPFLGTSLQIDDRSASDLFYGGLWFEVIF